MLRHFYEMAPFCIVDLTNPVYVRQQLNGNGIYLKELT